MDAAAGFTETFVNNYQIAQYHNPDVNLHRRENFKYFTKPLLKHAI
jgi:hypothetical protein